MLSRVYCYLLLSVVTCFAEEESVLVLTSDNFDEAISSNDAILVEFYAPWCGHCKALEPEYEKAASILKEDGIPLAKVDATVESEIARRYDVSGYPTIKWFRKGIAYDYEGDRTSDGLVRFVRERADPNWKPPPEEVLVLTQDNFTEVTTAAELILVEFYAPWCGHCKKLAPQYSKAAATLKEQGSSVKLAKVDATEEKELAEQNAVTGFPTLFMYRHGNRYDYKGPRDHHGIVQYMLEQSQPPAVAISSLKELEKMIKASLYGVVVAFLESESGDAYNKLTEIANTGREEVFSFFYSLDKSLWSKYGKDSLVVFLPRWYLTQREESSVIIEGFLDKPDDEVLQLIRVNIRSLVGIRSSHNAEKMFSDYPLLVAYFDLDDSDDGKEELIYWREKLLPVAKEHQGKLTVAMSNEQEYINELKDLTLADWGEEVAVAIWAGRKLRYAMKDDFTTENVQDFVSDYFANKLRPVIKSQPVPKKNKGPVKIVVGSTFDKIVNDASKDVMIELYAPWCGHCKKLEPIYKQLAERFVDNKKLVIAKIDATANDVAKGYDYTGFPTVYFSPAGGGQPMLYDGGRDVESLDKFLREHATFSLGEQEPQKDEL